MSEPLVSVIMPIFNHQDYVYDAAKSVLEQNYDNLEVIFLDDGSSDRSVSIVESVCDKYSRDTKIYSRENRGAHHTINEGINLSRGEFVSVINSDDQYMLSRIADCALAAKLSRAEFIFTDVEYIDNYGNIIEKDEYIDGLRKAKENISKFPSVGFALLKNNIAISTGNFFFSRRLFDKLRGFNSYRYVHDWDFILRSLFHTEPLFLDRKLYNYRVHGTNSYKSLSDIEGYETSQVMRNCLHQMVNRRPESRWAPSPHNWTSYFEYFIYAWNYHVYMP